MSNKVNLILEGLSKAKVNKPTYDDFKKAGNKFKVLKDVFYGSADAIMDVSKAKKLGFIVDKEDSDGYFEISIPKGTILTTTGKSSRAGVTLKVNGIELDFSDPEDMNVEKL